MDICYTDDVQTDFGGELIDRCPQYSNMSDEIFPECSIDIFTESFVTFQRWTNLDLIMCIIQLPTKRERLAESAYSFEFDYTEEMHNDRCRQFESTA